MSVKKESTLLEDMNQALAGETLAAFRYLYLSKIANGINSLPLATMFQEIAREEWAHASAFMGRIVQLGGVPVSRPAEMEKRSFLSYLRERLLHYRLQTLVNLLGAPVKMLEILDPFEIARADASRICQNVRY